MRTESEIKTAMETLKETAIGMGNNPHSPNCAMVIGACTFLGWAVGEGVYNKTAEVLLENFRDLLKGRVTRGPTTGGKEQA